MHSATPDAGAPGTPVARLLASRWSAPAAGGASLVSVALMIAALFPTFASQGCPGCSELQTGGLPSTALRASSEAWAVIWIIGVLAATALLFLAHVAPRLVSLVNAAASLLGLGLAVYEGIAIPRVLPAELVAGVPVFYVLGAGYFLFLVGGVVAVGAAVAMLLMRGEKATELTLGALTSPRVAATVGYACLASLAVAGAGAFLPFAGLNCGFGCPPFAQPVVSFSGAIAAGIDGWIVLALLAGAAIATVVRLTGRRNPLVSTIGVVLMLAATALVSFDSLNAATRVLGWTYSIPTSPELGYYLLQVGSAIGAVLALMLVAADRPSWPMHRPGGATAREAIRPA